MDTYAIVLYFDDVTNASINEIIKNVAIISGNNYMVEVNIPPHITIGSFLSGDYSELCKGIENIVDHIERGTVKFDSIKAFEPRVMFMSPINDTILEQLNELVHDQFLKNFLPADNDNYLPENWIPHCALAVRLSMEQFEKAMIIKNRIKFPIFAEIQKIALAKCNPYKEITVWDIR